MDEDGGDTGKGSVNVTGYFVLVTVDVLQLHLLR